MHKHLSPANDGEGSSGGLTPLTIGDLKDILGRALLEPPFLVQLQTNPIGTLNSLGIAADAKTVTFLQSFTAQALPTAASQIQLGGPTIPPAIVIK